MTVGMRAVVELVAAAAAALGGALSWYAARSSELAPPVLATEPSQVTMVYDPSLIVLALLLATIAGVLVVVGVARLRRSR